MKSDESELATQSAPEPTESTESTESREVEPSAGRTGRILVVGAVAVGVALRFWFALGPLDRTASSDEAVVGLMALRLVRHHQLYAFYWGQAYGGALESWLVAPFVAVFGANRLGLRTATVLLELATVWVTWRVALHLFPRRIAMWAGLLALFWPLTLVNFGTQERGFYPLTALLGLIAVLMALNIDEDPASRRHWFGLGLSIGVGWWMSPDILYYAIPVFIWLVLRAHWRQVGNVGVAALAFVIGASVWIVANLENGFASFHVPRQAGSSTYWTRFAFFWHSGLPFAFGLRRPLGFRWYWGPGWGHAVYAVVLVVIALSLRNVFKTRAIDVLLLAISPFVFAAFLPTWMLNEGRYLYFIASMLPLVLCRALQHNWGRVVVGGLVVASAFAFVGDYHRMTRPNAASIRPITLAVERAGYRTAIASYWIAYRMTYESGEKVVASPLIGQHAARYKPYARLVAQSRSAYVFYASGFGKDDTPLRNALDAAHIPYSIVRAPGYFAVLPARPLANPAP